MELSTIKNYFFGYPRLQMLPIDSPSPCSTNFIWDLISTRQMSRTPNHLSDFNQKDDLSPQRLLYTRFGSKGYYQNIEYSNLYFDKPSNDIDSQEVFYDSHYTTDLFHVNNCILIYWDSGRLYLKRQRKSMPSYYGYVPLGYISSKHTQKERLDFVCSNIFQYIPGLYSFSNIIDIILDYDNINDSFYSSIIDRVTITNESTWYVIRHIVRDKCYVLGCISSHYSPLEIREFILSVLIIKRLI